MHFFLKKKCEKIKIKKCHTIFESVHRSFCALQNIQMRKFRLKEGVKLVQYQSLKQISFIYSKLQGASFWPITLTVFSNTTK